MMARTRRIVILTGNHLCHNPRVIKEASCLADAGFDVEVLGAWLDERLAERDQALVSTQRFRFSPVVRLQRSGVLDRAQGTLLRAQRWTGTRLHRWFSLDHAWALGYGPAALARAALSRQADLYIAHSEPALWAACRLAREGRRIGVDMEDWFSRDLPPEARRWRPLSLIEALEREALTRASHRTCPSAAMSRALAEAYGVPPPAVIYNTFAWEDRARIDGAHRDRVPSGGVSVHWFSQTLGPGRGLEDLFAALRQLTPGIEIHLRGRCSGDYAQMVRKRLPASWAGRVAFHPLVDNDELLSRIAEHDIGLALEPDHPPNKNLTISNKMLQYLVGGLAVVAASTAGQREVAAVSPQGVALYRPGDAAGLAAAINALASQPTALARAKEANLRAAQERLCWERTAQSLLASVEDAFARPMLA